MTTTIPAEPHFDTLMDIMFAQCSDLEALLALAKSEAIAAEKSDFDQILQVVKDRATIGERLEVYHRQLAELRALLGEAYERALDLPVVSKTAAVIEAIRAEDARTSAMMLVARNEALDQSRLAEKARRNLGAYAQSGRTAPIACDRRI